MGLGGKTHVEIYKGIVRYARTVRNVSENHCRDLITVVRSVHDVRGETHVEM